MSLKYPAWKIFFALAVLCALLAEFFQHVMRRPEQNQASRAQEVLLDLEKEMQNSLNELLAFSTDSEYYAFFREPHHGFVFFHFENGKLLHWNENETMLPPPSIAKNVSNGISIQLPDGLYDAFEKSEGNKKITGLILLEKIYSYENKYLENHFNPLLGLDNQFKSVAGQGDYRLTSSSGNVLLSLTYTHTVPDVLPFKTPAWFQLIAFFFFVSGIFLLFRQRRMHIAGITATGIFLFLLRFVMIRFRLPGELYYNDFFSPKVYGSSFFFNSIGDFLLNAFSMVVFCGIIYTQSKKRIQTFKKTTTSTALMVAALAGLSILFYSLHLLIGDLVLNSKIIFDATLPDIDHNTIAAVLSVMLMLWSFYLVVAAVLFPYFASRSAKNTTLHFSTLRTGLIALLILSIYAAYVLNANATEKKTDNQKLFAQRLDARRDPLAEYLYQDLQNKIAADQQVRNIITDKSDVGDNLTRYLQQNFFTGYFTKFDVVVSAFDSSGNPFDSTSTVSLQMLQEQYAGGAATTSEKLTLQPDESGRLKYLSMLPLPDSTGIEATLVIGLTARPSQPAEGFPELLVSNAVSANREENNYSYARYSNGSLLFAGGNFPYALHSTMFEKNNGEFTCITVDGYRHVIYRPAAGASVVVSRPAENFFDQLSLFSYILIFFLSIFLVTHFFFYFIDGKDWFRLSLKQRIRSSIISLVIFSFALIAAGTSVYIIRKYDTDKNKTVLSRLNAMWFAITDRFVFDSGLASSAKLQWTGELNSIVSSFNLDFNLYDESGNLFYSSQPKLFEKGILSTRINPEALYEMDHAGKTQFVHTEHIGKLSFAAAYAPVTDRAGNIAGYLNLPYFEKQNELNREISGFLSALINIYLFLLVVSLLLALFITSRITKPLLLIQQRLRLVKLGSKNEIIEWKRNDEIGQLVHEYNKMVEALAESADRLSRSERESAWREMAQQVAHEIKNPLTPMKLSVQHLQRAWNEKSGNLDELFQRISKTMIEQIDTLSNIASEFSNFAKMPRTKNEMLVLAEVLRSATDLFKATPNTEIHFLDDGTDRMVIGDRDQLLRAISNLIKNAIQAISESRKGIISISVRTEKNVHHITITDNGSGIPKMLQSKIFAPNFTTKNSGMGLGLAMVKSTVEAIGGSIRFETEEGKGTSFHLHLPAA